MSCCRTTAPGRRPPRDYASPVVRNLRLHLCSLDQELEASEGRRQKHARLAQHHAQRDGLVTSQDWVRHVLRKELAAEAGRD
jgi:hypothetical protein